MSNGKATTLHQILVQRHKCLDQLNDETEVFRQLIDQLYHWEEEVIRKLKKFIEEKVAEIKEKRSKIVQEQANHLAELYNRSLNERIDPTSLTSLIKRVDTDLSKLQIILRKSLDFNDYLRIENHHELSTNLSYQLFSTISIQSNINPLLACDERLLIYFDHKNSTSVLQIVDLRKVLSQTNVERASAVKLRIPCRDFQGKILHLEYSPFNRAFLLATGSKLFLLQISTNPWAYRTIEYFDFVRGHLPGILQKFTCSISSSPNIFLLLKIFNNYRLTQLDMSEEFQCRNQWDYPFDKGSTRQTIDDFLLGHDQLVFAVTIETDGRSSHQIHVRSFDMKLQQSFTLSPTTSPVHLALIPSTSSPTQILSISSQIPRLSLYTILPEKFELIDEMTLDSELQAVAFLPQNRSIFFIRNLFHIGIYQRKNSP